MPVYHARISPEMSVVDSPHCVVSIYAGEDRHQLKFAGNLTLPREDAEGLVAIFDGEDRHVVELRPTSYTVKHPLSCRVKGLFSCDVYVEELPDDLEPGRYEITRMDDGAWVIGEKVNA